MTFLFDHNLSPQLIDCLADLYPQSQHIFQLGLDQATDRQVWNYARQNEFTIVTRDSDYSDLSILLGFPPKVIWIRRGNCSTKTIEAILRSTVDVIEDFLNSPSVGVLTLH
jgi:predicted nuclease of predicted toxin-antitoxin system